VCACTDPDPYHEHADTHRYVTVGAAAAAGVRQLRPSLRRGVPRERVLRALYWWVVCLFYAM